VVSRCCCHRFVYTHNSLLHVFEGAEQYDEELKKVGRRDDDRQVVTIDQFRNSVGAYLTYAWFPINERPTVEVSASCEGIDQRTGREDRLPYVLIYIYHI